MQLAPKLHEVIVPVGGQVRIHSTDELRALATMVCKGRHSAVEHRRSGGRVASLFVFWLRFPDATKEALSQSMWQSDPVELPLQADNRRASWRGPSARIRFGWHHSGLRMAASGIEPGLLMEISSKHPAVSVHQRYASRMSASWEPPESGFTCFHRGSALGKEALENGILCLLCLRDTQHQRASGGPSVYGDVLNHRYAHVRPTQSRSVIASLSLDVPCTQYEHYQTQGSIL
jgi:hypothetical protein